MRSENEVEYKFLLLLGDLNISGIITCDELAQSLHTVCIYLPPYSYSYSPDPQNQEFEPASSQTRTMPYSDYSSYRHTYLVRQANRVANRLCETEVYILHL